VKYGDQILVESGAIIETILDRHAPGALRLYPSTLRQDRAARLQPPDRKQPGASCEASRFRARAPARYSGGS